MNIDKQRKLLQFRKSKINLSLNIIHIFLLFITIAGYILFFTLIILLSGLSMWRGVYLVGMPLSVSQYNEIESISNINVYLVDIADSDLRYEVYATITTIDDYMIDIDYKYGVIEKIYLDSDELVFDTLVGYIIPEGTYDLKMEISNTVEVDTYKGVTSINVYLTNFDQTTLSNFFRPLPASQSPSQNSIILITSSSTGKYVPEIYRSPMFQGITKIQLVLIIYSVLNALKIVILFVLTKDARLEKKRERKRI